MKEKEIRGIDEIDQLGLFPPEEDEGHEQEAPEDEKTAVESKLWIRDMWRYLAGVHLKENNGRMNRGYQFALDREEEKNRELEKLGYIDEHMKEKEEPADEDKAKKDQTAAAVPKNSDQPVLNMQERPTRKQPAPEIKKKDYSEYAVESLLRIDLKKNQDNITRLYQLLESKNHWYRGSSENFRKVSATLKRLMNLSGDLVKLNADNGEMNEEKSEEHRKQIEAKLQEYRKCVKEVQINADNYLVNKKGHINSGYAQARYDAINEIREIMDVNARSMEEAYQHDTSRRTSKIADKNIKDRKIKAEKQKMEKWNNEVYKKYEIANGNDNEKAFSGKRNEKDRSAGEVISKYAIGRCSALTLSLLGMMNEKKYGYAAYETDDILNPDKLSDQKKDMYQKILNITDNKNPNEKELAGIMHDGFDAALERIDDLLKKVDFSDKNCIYNENLSKAFVIAAALHDVWQEMRRNEELLGYANEQRKKEKKEPYQSLDEYLDQRERQFGVISFLGKSVMSMVDNTLNTKKKTADVRCAELMGGAYSAQRLREILEKKSIEIKNKKAAEKKSIPFKDWLTREEFIHASGLYNNATAFFSEQGEISNAAVEEHLDEIIDGSIFEYVADQYDPQGDKVNVGGFIDLGIMNNRTNYGKLTYDELYRRLNNQISYYEEKKKNVEPKMQSYLNGAIHGATVLARYATDGKDLKPEKREIVKDAMKEIFACYVAEQYADLNLDDRTLELVVDEQVQSSKVYQKYSANIGLGSITGILFTDLTDEIGRDKNLQTAKAEAAREMIYHGGYGNVKDIGRAFSYGMALAIKENVGKMPGDWFVPHRYFSIKALADWYLSINQNKPEFKNKMEEIRKNPSVCKEIFNNKEALQKLVEDMNENRKDYLQSADPYVPKFDTTGFSSRQPALQKQDAEQLQGVQSPKKGAEKTVG